MDDTDFRILQAMGFQPYLPDVPPADALKPSRLAKRVGLGVKATKERIAAMERAGVIAGYAAFPNPRLFPLTWKSYHFRLPEERKRDFLAAAEPLDGVVGSFEFLGRDVCIDVWCHDEAESARRVKLLAGLAGSAPWEFYDNAAPAVARSLSPLEWRLVRAMRRDPKRPFAELARDLHVTAKTVKARFDRLVAEGSLWVVPVVDYGRIPGFVPFGMLVYARPDAPRSAVAAARSALAPDVLYSWSPPSPELGNLAVFLRARSTGEIEETRRRVAAMPGVERVELLVPTAVRTSSAWLDEAIERRCEQAASVRGPTGTQNGSARPLPRPSTASRERQASQR